MPGRKTWNMPGQKHPNQARIIITYTSANANYTSANVNYISANINYTSTTHYVTGMPGQKTWNMPGQKTWNMPGRNTIIKTRIIGEQSLNKRSEEDKISVNTASQLCPQLATIFTQLRSCIYTTGNYIYTASQLHLHNWQLYLHSFAAVCTQPWELQYTTQKLPSNWQPYLHSFAAESTQLTAIFTQLRSCIYTTQQLRKQTMQTAKDA